MIDPKFTEQIARWLDSEHTSREQIMAGAQLLLSLNRDHGMFQRIMHRPERMLSFLEYKLRRFLQIRKDGQTIRDVIKLDNEITPHLQAVINSEPIPVEGGAELLPVEQPAEKDGGNEMYIRKGIRPDHDQLPDNIKAIWPANAERWKKIKESYNLLLSLNAPCDRFEHLQLLKETWYKYKSEMCRYDDFRGTIDELVTVVKDKQISEKEQQDIDYAQSYISRNLPVLMELVTAAKEPDFAEAEKLESLREKVQNRVNTLLNLHVMLSDQRKADLLQCDIKIDLPSDNAEGEES